MTTTDVTSIIAMATENPTMRSVLIAFCTLVIFRPRENTENTLVIICCKALFALIGYAHIISYYAHRVLVHIR